jgi:PAS domain S-box-containing protein
MQTGSMPDWIKGLARVTAVAAAYYVVGRLGLRVIGHAAKLQAIDTDLQKEITDRKRAEDEVTKLAAIVESSNDAIFSNTLDGIIISWNRGARIIFGYSAEEVKGRSISILISRDRTDELLRILAQLKRGEPITHYETVCLKKDGTEVHVSLTMSPTKDAAGKITGSSTIARDVTKRTGAESVLQRHRDAVAHRLHDSVLQSLTAITMHLEMAQSHLRQDPQMAAQHLAKIGRVLSEEQQNLRSFVRELKGIGFARATRNSSGMAVMETLVKRLESQWDVRVELEVAPSITRIPTPIIEDLTYIVQEGVANAVRHGRASAVKVEVALQDGKLAMRIVDNGNGFPFHGYLDEAAVAAHRAAPAMLKNRVASLGGTLSIQSADSGACLFITLPPFSRRGAANGN